MSLDLGELTLRLELENDIGRGLAQAKREVETLPPTVQREMVKVSRVMDEEGRKSGGRLAQGINQGLIRNSPLIVAGIGAALAAGAPVMTVAAGTLFAGIGGAAAAQTLEVRQAWTAMGRDIRDSAVEDSAVLVPVYVQMADQIGAAFQRMRPQLRGAFADSAPLIESTTDGVIRLAENAMPGLARSVASAGPVFDGFESFLASTGQGLGDFFDRLSNHSPAAGAAFASLGDIVGDLLPVLGELLGQGAELASIVLPMMSTAMGGVLSVVTALGPALPPLVAAFGAFKVAGLVSGMLGNLGESLGNLGGRMQTSTDGASEFGETLQTAGEKVESFSDKAGPAIGAALSVFTFAMANAAEETDRWTQALLKGGDAADRARAEYMKAAEGGTAFGGSASRAGMEMLGLASSMNGAEEAANEYLASLDPLARAGFEVERAQTLLNEKVAEYGPKSNEAEGASRALKAAQGELERQSAQTELAISGVTSAMVEQAAQALAAIDSGFAYRNAVDGLEDAQASLAETIRNRTNADKDLRTTQEDVARAQLAVEEQSYRTALAFGQQQADLSGLAKDSSQYARIVQEQTLAKLYELQSAAGPEMKAAIGQQIAALQASGVALTGTGTSAASTAQKMRDLGLSVVQVPGSKTVFIDAPTADQKRRLDELGLTVRTLPNGRIYVTADTSPAAGTLAAFINQRRTIQIQAQVNTGGVRYPGAGGQPLAATGGRVGEVVRGFSGGGKLNGPGTPTSDSIPALTYSGRPLRVSDEEWVIQARAARMYGDARMAAINAGTAQVTVPGRGLAGGGPAANGAGPGVGPGTTISVVANTADERRIARRIVEEQRDAEFLAGVR